jgi:hypothetical protein
MAAKHPRQSHAATAAAVVASKIPFGHEIALVADQPVAAAVAGRGARGGVEEVVAVDMNEPPARAIRRAGRGRFGLAGS